MCLFLFHSPMRWCDCCACLENHWWCDSFWVFWAHVPIGGRVTCGHMHTCTSSLPEALQVAGGHREWGGRPARTLAHTPDCVGSFQKSERSNGESSAPRSGSHQREFTCRAVEAWGVEGRVCCRGWVMPLELCEFPATPKQTQWLKSVSCHCNHRQVQEEHGTKDTLSLCIQKWASEIWCRFLRFV